MSFIKRLLAPLNRDIATRGYQAAMETVLRRTKARLSVTGLTPSLYQTLQTEPVLLISNHPAEAEVLAIFSLLPRRSDFYLIANVGFVSILPALDKHIIPVHITHNIIRDSQRNWKLKILQTINPHPVLDRDSAHLKNIASINLASRHLQNGGLVTIFPGADNLEGHFRPGVGHLLQQIINPSQVKVVSIYVSGTSNFDYLRLLPIIGRFFPPISLTFSSPFDATEVIAADGKSTAQNLERTYKSWVAFLHPQPAPPLFRFSQRSYFLLRTLVLWFFTTR